MEETDTSEKIAIRDPISGQPVPLSSARGIAIWQDAASEFGVQFAKTNQSLMEVMSKYTGNPFASRYGEALIDNLSKQAGVQASGRMDPKEQQEWWEERQKFEADEARAADLNDRQADANERANEGHEQSMALGEQKIDANSRGVEDADRAREDEAIAREQQEAERAVEFNVGINNANDGKLNEHLAPELLKRLNAGEELSDGDKFTIAAANQRWEADEKAGIATEKSAKYFRVNNLENPETWMMDFQTTGSTGSGSNVFHALYNQEKAAAGNSLRLDYRADKSKTPEEKIAELERQGVHPTEAEWFVTDGTVSESVNLAFEQMAMTPEANLEANFRAGMQTLAHSEQMQTGMREKVTETIETYIEDMAANGTPLSEEHADRTRLDRHQSFLKIVNNGPPIPDADRGRYRSKQVQAALTGHYAKWDGIKLGRRSVINKEQERAELTRLNTETATRPRQGPQPAHPDYKPSHSKLKERVNFWANRVEQIKKTGGVPRGALQSLRKAEFKLNRQLELDKNTTATSSTIGAPAAIAKTSTIGA
ncbi:MAG: hypothetical protein OSA88_12445, partial [Acidimicrobiales bacterium]|nr:hypothetical protein [Acidimicrobiales bacterium]